MDDTKIKKGFSLIELLVVIAVIALLSSIALIALVNARVKSRDLKRIADVQNLRTALAFYYHDNRSYPNNLAALAPRYVASVPTPPKGTGQNAYQYARYGASPNVTFYHLGVVLEQLATAKTLDQKSCRSGSNTSGTPPQCVPGTNATAGGFNGKRATCTNGGGAQDLCYDLTP